MKSININGSLLELAKPLVMGIINVTPDSFFEGSRANQIDAIISKANKMIQEGATFLDIGGYSSRPGSTDISIEEELSRVLEPIREIRAQFPSVLISIDTFRSTVADKAVEAGAHIINDISGGHLDIEMLKTVGKLKVPYIGMHMKGNPQTMTKMASYNDLMNEVMDYFVRLMEDASTNGINDLIIDPGFGFAKTVDHNFELLQKMSLLGHLQKPILVGVSRKKMIQKTLDVPSSEALNGTSVLNTLALLKGASILRVHDVKEAVEVVKLIERYKN